MTIGRFIFAAAAGASLLAFMIFLGATFDPGYHGTGQIDWIGETRGAFQLQYLTMLYLPPIATAAFSYLAFRRTK